ncbi:aspartyl-phosphate phosphatase Spo0E family protein [Inediibacterium massiliense]|uniref:aspartyl-phosphate phosphatase Spo0E family protein n=1 Tax=Inediibacterium massiliense TaxID=1658111 RepID=UPI000DA63E17|nr:aspartyl-phosphate phosphatase Spo0E family protein [Inediibacterium massiliense]
MVKKEIEILRQRLNDLIQVESNYEQIYRVSVQLDELITTFYKNQNKEVVV